MVEYVFLCCSVILVYVCELDIFKNCVLVEWILNNEGFYFWKLVKMIICFFFFGYIFDNLVYSVMLC